MKKLLTILLCLPLLIMAQAPQGFTYQGVATDNNGFELQNQTISIQASILSSSATGTTVWQETHTTTTDTFGLFNVTIGEGISTNSGSSTTFQEIDWGAASHFMKVEIDVNGGSNYLHVGTSQMMSVPYALYAENANNINMDSISNYLIQDSIFNTAFGSGGGCDFNFPEGLEGDFISIDMLQGNYTVPSGKNLYILNAMTDVGQQWINLDGKRFVRYEASDWKDNTTTVMAGSGSVLSSQYQSSSPTSSTMFGYLVDENYFADCGGGGFGGSSSTANVSLDYDSLANILANNSAFLSSITISSALDSVTVAAMIANAMGNSSGSSVPTGVVQAYSGTAAPTGWLLCDGSAVSRITYPDLFALIDTTYGFGDGSYTLQWVDANNDGIMQPGEMINVMSTFNVPDLRGRTIIAADNMGGTSANVVGSADALGSIGGAETHTLTENEMPSHIHTNEFGVIPATGNGNNPFEHRSSSGGQREGNNVNTLATGGDQPHNNMPPYLIMNYIIKY